MYGIREHLLRHENRGYHEHALSGSARLDCSLGANPYGCMPLDADEAHLELLHRYPTERDALVAAVTDYLSPCIELDPEMVDFSFGSIAVIALLHRICLHPGKDYVCVAPTFSAATDNARTHDVALRETLLVRERSWRFDADAFCDQVARHPGACVYLDNPNNPTGQAIPLKEVERVVACAEAAGSFAIVDEAYGDYMPRANSAVRLVTRYPNLAVVKSFSKALGGAGLRLGYAIAQPQVIATFRKVNIPYSCTTLGCAYAVAALKGSWRADTRAKVRRDKARMAAALHHIRMAHTDPGVPISMLYVDDVRIDLARLLMSEGIRSINCHSFEGLGPWAVRVNLHEDIDTLCELLSRADDKVARAHARA